MALVCQPRFMSCWTTLFCISLLYLLVGGGAQHPPGPPPRPSVYDALKKYNFPPGILPLGVASYELNPNSGEFTAHLNGRCNYTLDGKYKLRYEPTITGVISPGKLEKLKGITVKALFLWVSVVEVQRNEEELVFSTHIKSATFPVSEFEECPRCGCGFDC